MDKEFVNPRIEAAFEASYDGRNQLILTGGIDDLFMIVSRKKLKTLCSVDEAVAEYGRKKNYDFIITVENGGENLTFASPEQEKKFSEIVRGKTALPSGISAGQVKGIKLKPRKNEPPAANKDAQKAAEEASKQVSAQGDNNQLALITRLLKEKDYKSLVIFPYPEKMLQSAEQNAQAVQKIETITKDWRNIIQTAHPDTRTVLIINPHRLEQFQAMEHYVSCFDHNCRLVRIGLPDRKEIEIFAKKYAAENAIESNPRDLKRVVLTGNALSSGDQPVNLQNIVSWIQGFYLKHPEQRTWQALLEMENREAADTKEDLLKKLDDMIGLAKVKEEIHKIVENAEKTKSASDQNYHMFFLGNPGTGKTEVANIIAKLFWAMELRTSRKCVTITIQDVVGEYNEGEAIQKMKNKVQEAMGGVLFIDEAYLFAESEWGAKAFQTLLTEMENNRDNLTVILAGYEERLQKLKDVNPGIDSRIGNRLHFQDYTPEEKLEIFKFFLNKRNIEDKIDRKLTSEAEKKLLRIFERLDGNARGVRNLRDKVLKEIPNKTEIGPDDIPDPHEINEEKVKEILKKLEEDFVGMDALKNQLEIFFSNVRFHVKRNEALGLTRSAEQTAYRLRFTGPPGTGKTSVARRMGEFFHAMGICETSECIECGATTLKGAYLGHAQKAVNSLFHENRGKVIFIDEIYSLYNPNAGQDDSFSREAVDTLVRCLTAEEYRDTVVIVAGYKAEVDQFMEVNPGLASRIPVEIEFQDYSPETCLRIFEKTAQAKSYSVREECREKLLACFKKRIQQSKKDSGSQRFGNARTVYSVLDEAVSRMVNRLKDNPNPTEQDFRDILPEDIPD